MEYIAVDFEWNQPYEGIERFELNEDVFFCGEIIQIGAVKLDSQFNIVSTFSSLVRPTKYVRMNRKVEALTGISERMLEKAPLFTEIADSFKKWCGDEFMFITWGFDDIRVLRQNLELHDMQTDWLGRWVNLQIIYNLQTDSSSSQKSLGSAMEHFGIDPDESRPAHNALNDAYYTALICKCLDTEKGIREYSFFDKYDKFPQKNRHKNSSKFSYGGFETKKSAFLSEEISVCLCPVCNERFSSLTQWSRKQNFRYKAIGVCKEHGRFNVRLSFKRESALWSVSKVIYPCTSSERKG